MDKIIVTNMFSFIGFLTAILFSIVNFIHGNFFIGFIELGAGVLCFLNLIFFRIYKKTEIAGSLVLTLMLIIVAGIVISGGLNQTGIVWIYTFAPLAIFLKRKNKGFLWVLCLILTVLLVYLMSQLNWFKIAYNFEQLRQALSSFLALTLMIYFYEKGREENEYKIIQTINKSAEKEVQVKALEKSNRELAAFAHTIAHDLKSPLTGISGIADLLILKNEKNLNSEDLLLLSNLKQSTQRMFNLIDAVLAYSKIGKVEGQVELINLRDVLQEVFSMIYIPKSIQVEIKKALPFINGVRVHVYQIFQNLIQNAVKYMDKENGRIVIDFQDKEEFYLFSVADNGPGIEQENLPRIFQIFFTTDHSNRHKSTGIGLSTVKKIIELYGGKIWVESQVKKGTVFYFTFLKK